MPLWLFSSICNKSKQSLGERHRDKKISNSSTYNPVSSIWETLQKRNSQKVHFYTPKHWIVKQDQIWVGLLMEKTSSPHLPFSIKFPRVLLSWSPCWVRRWGPPSPEPGGSALPSRKSAMRLHGALEPNSASSWWCLNWSCSQNSPVTTIRLWQWQSSFCGLPRQESPFYFPSIRLPTLAACCPAVLVS